MQMSLHLRTAKLTAYRAIPHPARLVPRRGPAVPLVRHAETQRDRGGQVIASPEYKPTEHGYEFLFYSYKILNYMEINHY